MRCYEVDALWLGVEIGSFCKSGQTRGEKSPNSHTLPTFVRETPTSSPSAQPTDAIFTKMDIHLKKLRISSWGDQTNYLHTKRTFLCSG